MPPLAASSFLNRRFRSLQGADKDDVVFGVREPQPLERASIRVVPLDRDTIKEFFPSLKVGGRLKNSFLKKSRHPKISHYKIKQPPCLLKVPALYS